MPAILIVVTAVPGREESRMRRRNPERRAVATLQRLDDIFAECAVAGASTHSMRGFSISTISLVPSFSVRRRGVSAADVQLSQSLRVRDYFEYSSTMRCSSIGKIDVLARRAETTFASSVFLS
jgi:hypothetical protein